MHRRRGIFGAFLFFLFVAILLFFAFRVTFLTSLLGIVQLGTLPIQRGVHSAFWGISPHNKSQDQLVDENKKLQTQLVQMEELKKENAALHDQFDSIETVKYEQLPARIVGTKGFIPGISLPTELIIDRGSSENVAVGNALVYKNNLLGKVVGVTPHSSLVDPTTKDGISLTGKELSTGSLGVIKGQGDGIILDNVILADTLNVGDLVVSKGDLNIKGIGIPPDLIIGKITSLDRHPSNLFQSAEIQSLVDITQLTTVFVLRVK